MVAVHHLYHPTLLTRGYNFTLRPFLHFNRIYSFKAVGCVPHSGCQSNPLWTATQLDISPDTHRVKHATGLDCVRGPLLGPGGGGEHAGHESGSLATLLPAESMHNSGQFPGTVDDTVPGGLG